MTNSEAPMTKPEHSLESEKQVDIASTYLEPSSPENHAIAYSHGDKVEYARSASEAIALCTYLGEIAKKSPEKANRMLRLVQKGQEIKSKQEDTRTEKTPTKDKKAPVEKAIVENKEVQRESRTKTEPTSPLPSNSPEEDYTIHNEPKTLVETTPTRDAEETLPLKIMPKDELTENLMKDGKDAIEPDSFLVATHETPGTRLDIPLINNQPEEPIMKNVIEAMNVQEDVLPAKKVIALDEVDQKMTTEVELITPPLEESLRLLAEQEYHLDTNEQDISALTTFHEITEEMFSEKNEETYEEQLQRTDHEEILEPELTRSRDIYSKEQLFKAIDTQETPKKIAHQMNVMLEKEYIEDILQDLSSLEAAIDEDSLDLDTIAIPKLTKILEILLDDDTKQEVAEELSRLEETEVKEFITNLVKELNALHETDGREILSLNDDILDNTALATRRRLAKLIFETIIRAGEPTKSRLVA